MRLGRTLNDENGGRFFCEGHPLALPYFHQSAKVGVWGLCPRRKPSLCRWQKRSGPKSGLGGLCPRRKPSLCRWQKRSGPKWGLGALPPKKTFSLPLAEQLQKDEMIAIQNRSPIR